MTELSVAWVRISLKVWMCVFVFLCRVVLLRQNIYMCVCVCVCVRARARVRACVCVCAYLKVYEAQRNNKTKKVENKEKQTESKVKRTKHFLKWTWDSYLFQVRGFDPYARWLILLYSILNSPVAEVTELNTSVVSSFFWLRLRMQDLQATFQDLIVRSDHHFCGLYFTEHCFVQKLQNF
jgi:hypothetical protein